MKLQILSDLHLEFRDGSVFIDGEEKPELDIFLDSLIASDSKERVLVLAGDICQVYSHVDKLKAALALFSSKYRHVVYIAGNHEYYYASFAYEVDEALATLVSAHPNVHFLNNSSVIIDSQRFIGGTMWYSPIRDQKAIPGLWNWSYTLNANFKNLLNRELCPLDIVVSHHLPSMKCVDPQFRDASNQSYFVSPCDSYIRDRSPKLWIHGHTHSPINVTIDKTLVLANPAGYPGERQDFNPLLLVEVGTRTARTVEPKA